MFGGNHNSHGHHGHHGHGHGHGHGHQDGNKGINQYIQGAIFGFNKQPTSFKVAIKAACNGHFVSA